MVELFLLSIDKSESRSPMMRYMHGRSRYGRVISLQLHLYIHRTVELNLFVYD